MDTKSKVNESDINNLDPLLINVLDNNARMVAYLVDHGISVDLNKKYAYGRTALHFSVEEGDFNVTLHLLRGGANINAENDEGITPIVHAIDNQDERITKLLLSYDNIDLNQGFKGAKPLHLAAYYGNTNIIKLLLDNKNIEVNAQILDSEGHTPLDIADKYNNKAASELIKKAGGKKAKDLNKEIEPNITIE